MPESSYKDPEQFAHVDEQADREFSDAAEHYTISVFEDDGECVATQPDASLEARGFSPAEAIANFANAVEAKNNGEQVIADE
ncbi:hypothetical protein [Halopiger xanaduensis]|uniref:Uncharacterized protein n=1 Tax=Halopiger xanaduensis (strain DSM 18323 / JCM 14033 / SH-6) TaxID=797210 RepID=F8DEP1_HALXS|nr:hypothetical protein [Halopiger xanaduensis]AEH39478.1 hypothetical protein Halxa_0238 [Halopiger xanaduensis SH-6]